MLAIDTAVKNATLRRELARDLRDEVYDFTDEGIYFPRNSELIVVGKSAGEYIDSIDSVNGGPVTVTPNLLTLQGRAHILSVAFGATPKPAGYFLALFNGAAAVNENWVAASFAATAGEIVSMSEGYTSATRPAWTPPASTATSSIDNFDNKANLVIATASSLNVTGIALLTNSTRGGTTGVLVSAARYAVTRVFQDGDDFSVGYRTSLTI